MDLSALSAEERQALLEELQADAQDPGEILSQAFTMIFERLQAVDERCARVEKLVVEELIGGLDDLYQGNLRIDGIKGLKDKYGGLFGPMEGDYKSMYPDGDLWEKLFDSLEEMKGGEGYTDEVGDGKVKGYAEELKKRIEAVRGPKAVEVVKTVTEEEDPMKPVLAKVERMKRGRVPGMTGQSRD